MTDSSDPNDSPETPTPIVNVLDAQTPDGRRVVVLMIASERHATTIELAPERAEALAEVLGNFARTAASGLHIATEVPS